MQARPEPAPASLPEASSGPGPWRDRAAAVAAVWARAARALEARFAQLVLAGCGLFGVALVFQTQLAGDGVWFWYARELLEGRRLYADLGLALQPLFVMLQALVLDVAGTSWLATRIPALLAVALFLVPIHLVAGRVARSTYEHGIWTAFVFFVGIHFEAYRFDDYHVLVDAFYVVAALLLLSLSRAEGPRRMASIAAALGAVSGLAIVTRLNGGALLLVVTTFLVAVLARRRKALLAALTVVVASAAVLAVVAATGDTIRDWVRFSIVGAASSKGGGAGLLASPLLLPWNAARFVLSRDAAVVLAPLLLVALAVWLGVRARALPPAPRWAVRAAMLAGVLWAARPAVLPDRNPIVHSAAAGAVAAYVALAALAVRVAWAGLRLDPRRLSGDAAFLPLLAILHWVSGSMSTGGWHFGLYFAFALFLLLLALAHPRLLSRDAVRLPAIAVLAVIAAAAAAGRWRNPCSWHSYGTAPLFERRAIVAHRLHGPMVIDRELHAFVAPICSRIEASGEAELLSLPFPYANWFCGIAPWNGYVQTFFDTSSAETIGRLVEQLRQGPPAWILYQRQLANLELHERVFNSGKPLPHRRLDELVLERVAAGQWSVVETRLHGPGNEWLLISTR